MTFDELQKTWQSQQSSFKLTIDSDMLLREVKRNKKNFESTVFWRDVREVGVAFVLFAFLGYHGLKSGTWPVLLLALVVAEVGIFMIVDRVVQKKKLAQPADSLMDYINISLAQVNHQIWLLRNIFWWYLLPPGIGLGIFISHVGWSIRSLPGMYLILLVAYAASCVLLFWGVYRLNQRAVRKELNPRKQELEGLLHALKNAQD